MKVRFWGVRGSIPSPGPDTVRYGGNTTSIEITTDAGHTIIFDAGTGIRRLGLKLMEEGKQEVAICLSHTHWDHIQGLPFFVPLFVPGKDIHFYGAFDPVQSVPSVSEVLQAANEGHLWIVQFASTPTQRDRDAIAALGGERIGYLPKDAYVFRMDAAAADATCAGERGGQRAEQRRAA